jgi:peptide/nickel transport system ATP-binding protein
VRAARELTLVLEIRDLQVDLVAGRRYRRVLQKVSLALEAGGTLGLVGESGSGKSMTARAIMRLLPSRAKVRGEINFDGRPIGTMRGAELRGFRSRDVGIIYQDPRVRMNPIRTIGDYLEEGARDLPRAQRRAKALSALTDVGIADPERRIGQYPYQLSGGLLQRVMIAAATLPRPRLLLADEPTTALDVTTQSTVVAMLKHRVDLAGSAMLFITHDLDLACAVTDRLAVMYAGTIVEVGPSQGMHRGSLHPYTVALMRARPSLSEVARLETIPGAPLAAYEVGSGCAFASRCGFVQARCLSERPELRLIGDHLVACHRSDEFAVSATGLESAV